MSSGHMSSEEFRQHGHRLIDWLADYLEGVDSYPIRPEIDPGEILARLPETAPEQAEPFSEIIADLDRVVLPGVTHWQSPGFFGFFPANTSPPAILGELVAAGLGQQGMLWATSPACTEIEMRVLDWLVDLLGLPAGWKTSAGGGGVIQVSASDSTHLALVVAREQRGPDERLVAYGSEQAHSSFEKGARVAGYRHLRQIEVDRSYAMDADALARAVAEDKAAGLIPALVCSTVGTTGTTAVDPIRAIGEIARHQGMWHHVDAAFAGSAMICPEFRHHQDGLALVDSYVFNPHKWMFTNFDCSVFYVADRRPLIEAMRIVPPYLANQASETGQVIDYRDWQVPLGRRFRSLKLWFVLRSYGAEGIRRVIREHIRLAQELAAKVESHPALELVAPVTFSLVCFRHRDGAERTQKLADAINASGHSLVTPSVLDGGPFIRVSIGQTWTAQPHVDRLWSLIEELA